MNITLIRTLEELKAYRGKLELLADIGLVPTMGNLHAGHISLLEESLKHHVHSVVSIFVNPKQFGPNEDYAKYPRTLEADLEKIKAIHAHYPERKVAVFAPAQVSDVFPVSFLLSVTVGSELTSKLCGQFRPGHFDGVTTVVYRLFSLVKPRNAYFGLKDYQQYLIIRKMVEDMELDLNIVGMPIIREPDGLALSSRNQYLKESDRPRALHLSKTLQSLAKLIQNDSRNGIINAINAAKQEIQSKEWKWDYLEILDAHSLSKPQASSKKIVIAGALKIGDTRLIDNTITDIAEGMVV